MIPTKKTVAQTISELIQIPRLFHLESKSEHSLLYRTGYFQNYGKVSESDIRRELIEHPEEIELWIQMSEDKRCGGWYLKRCADGGLILGHWSWEKAEKGEAQMDEIFYADSVDACAAFIKREMEVVRKLDIEIDDSPDEPDSGIYGPPLPFMEKLRLEQEARLVDVPRVEGTVPPGGSLLGEANVQEMVTISRDLASGEHQYFQLLAGIDDGDLVLVRQQSTAEEGQRIVALIDGNAIFREYSQTAENIVLKPRSTNPVHEPILLTDSSLIQGVVHTVWQGWSKIADELRGFQEVLSGRVDQIEISRRVSKIQSAKKE